MKTSTAALPLFAAPTTRALTVRTDVRAGAMERRVKGREQLTK